MAQIFKIPVSWEAYSTIDVEAETLEEALEKFDDFENNQEGYPLPKDWEYLDGSFSREDIEFCKLVNSEI